MQLDGLGTRSTTREQMVKKTAHPLKQPLASALLSLGVMIHDK